MAKDHDKLMIGHGTLFVKSRLRLLPQTDDVWEAGFVPIPVAGRGRPRQWLGMVVSQPEGLTFTVRHFEAPPTVNDLAFLLADAMRRPMIEVKHQRPRKILLSNDPQWEPLIPHIEQLGIEVATKRQLPACKAVAATLFTKDRQRPPVSRPVRGEKRAKAVPSTVYQFMITLAYIEPPIWRRIQTKDCTLDKLHEHIQTAMGWTNSHLHHFRIGKQLYGDPMLMGESFSDLGYKDSTITKLSEILPRSGRRFRFDYEYDFGDGWKHEILFEGRSDAKKGVRYPLCLEGQRACPPEDVGGPYGYQDYLEALADPEHEEHDSYLEWGGPFDPEAFDAQAATREMRKGLPDWREME